MYGLRELPERDTRERDRIAPCTFDEREWWPVRVNVHKTVIAVKKVRGRES